MTNDPVLIAYAVKDRTAKRKAIWRRIGVAFPHDKGAGLTVILDALPTDGRIVLVEPRADPANVPPLRPPPSTPPSLTHADAEGSS
jgi:hypothetical protein